METKAQEIVDLLEDASEVTRRVTNMARSIGIECGGKTVRELFYEVERRCMALPLDKDGVPLAPGDCVREAEDDGTYGPVTKLVVSGYQCFSGGDTDVYCREVGLFCHKGYTPGALTHTPPAPKALDADGVEIREGDTVWARKGSSFGRGPFKVHMLTGKSSIGVDVDCPDGQQTIFLPEELTHRKPAPKALDADGVECKVGDRVWCSNVGGGVAEGVITRVGGVDLVDVDFGDFGPVLTSSKDLTHTEPDSWDALYVTLSDILCESDAPGEQQARDLVRRATALAGVK